MRITEDEAREMLLQNLSDLSKEVQGFRDRTINERFANATAEQLYEEVRRIEAEIDNQ